MSMFCFGQYTINHHQNKLLHHLDGYSMSAWCPLPLRCRNTLGFPVKQNLQNQSFCSSLSIVLYYANWQYIIILASFSHFSNIYSFTNCLSVFFNYFFLAIISYKCQCFIFPNPVFPSLSISSKWIISNLSNKFKTCSFDKNTILSFILAHESFSPKKFPTKYPIRRNTINYFIPKFIKIIFTTKRNTVICNNQFICFQFYVFKILTWEFIFF